MQILAFNYWIFLGFLFMILEIVLGKFYALFIGLGALFIGILTWSGILYNTRYEIGIFIFSSLIGILFFRKGLYRMYYSKSKVPDKETEKVPIHIQNVPSTDEV